MKTTIEILDQELLVDYDIRITSHAHPATGPSYACGGEPPEPMEFEVTVTRLRWIDVPNPVMPDWLKEMIETHLSERDDINDIAHDMDSDRDQDPDDARDAWMDRDL